VQTDAPGGVFYIKTPFLEEKTAFFPQFQAGIIFLKTQNIEFSTFK